MVSDILQADIYLKTGVKDKRRTIILKDVKTNFVEVINRSGKCLSDFLEAVVSLHAFTGCDTISSPVLIALHLLHEEIFSGRIPPDQLVDQRPLKHWLSIT